MGSDDVYYVSNSELDDWSKCRRLWFYKHYLRRAPSEPNKALTTGTAWHDLMEVLYADPHGDGAENALISLARATLDPQPAVDYELLYAMLTGYIEWLEEEGADYKLTFTHIEDTGEMHLLNHEESGTEVRLRGKMDLIAQDDDTAEDFLVDHKSSRTWDIFNTALLNQQNRTYALLTREDPSLPTVAGTLFSVARKVKRTNTAKPPFFRREKYYFNDGMLDNHHKQVTVKAFEIADAIHNLNTGGDDIQITPPSVQYTCDRCPFFDVCAAHDDPASDWQWLLETEFALIDPDARYNTEEP